MADQILTLQQVEDIFVDLTSQILGYNPVTQGNKVRTTWPRVGQPGFKSSDDVVFIKINTEFDPITQQRDVNYSDVSVDVLKRKASYTRVQSIRWTIYGPNAYDIADKIRNAIFLPSVYNALAPYHLFLIVDVQVPVRVPEEFNGQWYDRVDFVANYNEHVIRESDISTLKDIKITTKTQKGVTKDVNITT